jgi:hypothetical protein
MSSRQECTDSKYRFRATKVESALSARYASRVGDDDMLWADHAAIRFAIAKAGAIASTCRYEFKMQASGGADVAG